MTKLPDFDYVELYAQKLKKDNSIFGQQKRLIDSQILASRSFFSNMLATSRWKEHARKYLKAIGVL